MYAVRRTDDFSAWLDSLKDGKTRARLVRRLEKAERGNLGDVAPVGDGVCEMREFFGSGWRMYYMKWGDMLIVMLGGGDKSSQNRDIAAAKRLATTMEE